MQNAFRFPIIAVFIAGLLALTGPVSAAEKEAETYDQETVLDAATGFFGAATEGLAKVIQKIFEEQGEPNAYIAGDEISGAFIVGLRYGRGELNQKGKVKQPIFWQGPSVGFDFGGNASKTFVLIYNMSSPDDLFRRFPGLDGSFYFVAGVGVNYQTDGVLTVAPIRTGVGLRAGASLGYLHYTRESSWFPL